MQLITPRELAAVFKGHPAEKGASSPGQGPGDRFRRLARIRPQ